MDIKNSKKQHGVKYKTRRVCLLNKAEFSFLKSGSRYLNKKKKKTSEIAQISLQYFLKYKQHSF